jgi:hypothetical protein
MTSDRMRSWTGRAETKASGQRERVLWHWGQRRRNSGRGWTSGAGRARRDGGGRPPEAGRGGSARRGRAASSGRRTSEPPGNWGKGRPVESIGQRGSSRLRRRPEPSTNRTSLGGSPAPVGNGEGFARCSVAHSLIGASRAAPGNAPDRRTVVRSAHASAALCGSDSVAHARQRA